MKNNQVRFWLFWVALVTLPVLQATARAADEGTMYDWYKEQRKEIILASESLNDICQGVCRSVDYYGDTTGSRLSVTYQHLSKATWKYKAELIQAMKPIVDCRSLNNGAYLSSPYDGDCLRTAIVESKTRLLEIWADMGIKMKQERLGVSQDAMTRIKALEERMKAMEEKSALCR